MEAERKDNSNGDKNGEIPVDSNTTNKDSIDADGRPDTKDDLECNTVNYTRSNNCLMDMILGALFDNPILKFNIW